MILNIIGSDNIKITLRFLEDLCEDDKDFLNLSRKSKETIEKIIENLDIPNDGELNE